MALVVETGAIVPGADSFVTQDAATTYHAARGNAAWALLSSTVKDESLRKACDYLQAMEPRYKGDRVSADQVLSWPRYDVCLNGFDLPSDRIPAELKEAQIILALEAQSLDLLPTLDAAAQKGATLREKVDVIEVEYDKPAVQRDRTAFAKADALLAKLYKVAGGLSIVRA